ncbi:MAG: Dabb family protein [Chthoniobacter sp.]
MKTKSHLIPRFFLTSLALLGLAFFSIRASGAEPAEKGKLTHVGLVWLKNPGNAAERQRLIDALHRFAREIPEVRSLSVGQPHPSTSKLVDSTFDVCFTMQFDDQAALDRYSKTPVHQKAAQELFLPLSQKILFYDFITE